MNIHQRDIIKATGCDVADAAQFNRGAREAAAVLREMRAEGTVA